MTSPTGRIAVEVVPDLARFPGQMASGLRGVAGLAGSIGKGLGVAVAGGAAIAAVGLKQVITLGNEYQANLNELQAVSGATASQMRLIGKTAQDLGSDLTLPATSASDAAAAMVELAKGGLSVDEAMKAAKGTLQLAAAAQVDGATAAEIQSSALNAFGLQAGEAGRVADVLANTANAAAGSITDVGYSLKYVAPVAAALKVSIEDTAAAIGLLANQGVKGEQAGTSLRGILASLSSPSKEAKKGLDALGVSVFDTSGKFIGLRAFTDQLSQAKKRLTDQEFAAAASTAFGNEGLTAANALAAEGAAGFDQMATAVARQGGAAEVAAAKTKGLGGAIEGFNSQVETASIGIYEAIAPPLERGVRAAASFVERFTPTVVNGIQTAVTVGETFGPRLAKAIGSKVADLRTAGESLLRPVVEGVAAAANGVANIGIEAVAGFGDVARKAAAAITPLAQGVGDLARGFASAGGPLAAARVALGLAYDAVAGIVTVAAPVVKIVGDLVSAFSDLPGPVQTAAVALLALRFGPQLLGSLRDAFTGAGRGAEDAERRTGLMGRAFSAVTAPVRLLAGGLSGVAGTVRQFNDEARVAQSLGGLRTHITNIGAGAAVAGPPVGRLAGYTAAFNTSTIPAIAAARAFRDQTVAIRNAAVAVDQPISTFTAAMGALAERSPGIAAVANSFTRTSATVSAFAERAGLAAGIATEAFVNKIPAAASTMASSVSSAGRTVSAGLGSAVAAFRALPTAVGVGFITAASSAQSGARSVVESVRSIPAAVSLAAASVSTGAKALASSVGSGLVTATQTLQTGARGIATAVASIPTAINSAAGTAAAGARSLSASVANGFSSAVAAVKALPTAIGVAGVVAVDRARTIATGIGVGFSNAADKIRLLPTAIGTGLLSAVDRIPGAVQSSVTALGNLGSKAAGVAAVVGTGLSRAATGLVGALGGPFGIALAGASLALGLLADNQQKAAAGAQAHRAGVDRLASALRDTGGAVNDLIRNQIGTALVTEYKAGADAAKSFGISLSDVTSAVISGGPAITDMARRLSEIVDQDPLSQQGRSAQALLVTLASLRDQFGDAVEQNRRLNEVSGDTSATTLGLSRAVGTLASSSASAEDKASALRETLKLLTSGAQDARDAQASFYNAIDGLSERLSNATGQILNSAGALDITSQKGRQVNEVLKTSQQSFSDFAASQSAAGKSSGDIQQGLQQMRDSLLEVLTPLVGSKDAANALIDQFKLIPADISIAVTSPGMITTRKAAELLAGSVKSIPNDKTVVVTSLTDEAEKKLKELGFKIERLSNGEVQITADDAVAMGQLQNYLAIVNSSTGTAKIAGDPQPAYDANRRLLQYVDQSRGTTTTDTNAAAAYNTHGQFIGFVNRSYATARGEANFQPAYNATGAVIGYINRQSAAVQVGANTSAARDAIDGFIGAYGNKQIRIGVAANIRETGAMAAGGILQAKAFAAGGVAQRRLTPMRGGYADIVGPNTWRIIGDRLRGKEAYIPIEQTQRSIGILSQTARDMGFALTRLYANGGVAMAGGSSAGVSVSNPPAININNQVTVRDNDDAATYARVNAVQTAWQLRSK